MPTFLVTRKMHPALAARVQASVRGRSVGALRSKPPAGIRWAALVSRASTVVRLGAAVLVVVAIASVVSSRRQAQVRVERARAALLDDLHTRGAGLTTEDRGALGRMESWTADLAGPYPGDVVAEGLRGPGAAHAVLILSHPEAGTPQGGVISPLLTNIYLHEVLDEWFVRDVQPRLRGRATLVRYADDLVFVFSQKEDAERVLDVLPKRFGKYGLTLHPDKTRLVPFQRPDRDDGDDNGPGSFDLLGFTHHWGLSRKGNWVVR